MRHFWHNLLCDIYLEQIKPIVNDLSEENRNQRNAALNVLKTCITTSLRAIHPLMPFVTENLWQHIRQTLDPSLSEESFASVCDEDYPDFSGSEQSMAFFDYEVKREMSVIRELVQKIRWFRQYFQIPKHLLASEVLIAVYGNRLEKYKRLIETTAKVSGIRFVSIHDIHRYDNHFCYKITANDGKRFESDSDSDSDSVSHSEVKNSFDDCYLLFDIDLESLIESMNRSNLQPQVIQQKSDQLKQNKCSNFHTNYWKTKSKRESIN